MLIKNIKDHDINVRNQNLKPGETMDVGKLTKSDHELNNVLRHGFVEEVQE